LGQRLRNRNALPTEFRGYVQYYILAQNLSWLSKLQWFMSSSMLKTLAAKHQTSIRTEQRKTESTRHTSDGPRRCYQVTVEREGKKPLVSYFGGISLSYKKSAIIEDKPLQPIAFRPGPDLLVRFAAELCELCGSEQNVEVHHIRRLKDLKLNGRKERPRWVLMINDIRVRSEKRSPLTLGVNIAFRSVAGDLPLDIDETLPPQQTTPSSSAIQLIREIPIWHLKACSSRLHC
jgi:AI2M/AI1M-like HNH endonuclease/type II intron maturase